MAAPIGPDSGDGTTNVYAALVRRLGTSRPISGLAPPRGELGSVAELAAGHVETLTAADPEGPYLLGGFCFGAWWRSRWPRLRGEGRDVRHLALVNVSAFDFPSLVSPDAAARDRAAHRPVPRTRRYLARTHGRDAWRCSPTAWPAVPGATGPAGAAPGIVGGGDERHGGYARVGSRPRDPLPLGGGDGALQPR